GLAVKWDGASMGEGLFDSAIPVDAGEHAIEAGAPGKKTWKGKAVVPVTPGSMMITIPALEDAPAEAAKETSEASAAGGWSTRRTVGVVVGSVGVAGIIAGSVAGAITLGKKGEAKEHCSPDLTRCDPVGLKAQNDGGTTAKIADVAFAIGGAAVIAGVVI